jgi:hypothetical protein
MKLCVMLNNDNSNNSNMLHSKIFSENNEQTAQNDVDVNVNDNDNGNGNGNGNATTIASNNPRSLISLNCISTSTYLT